MISDLNQASLGNPAFPPLDPLHYFIYNQLKILRVILTNYAMLSFPSNRQDGSLSNEEMISSSDKGIKVSLDYFAFIAQLNQFGATLKEKHNTPTIPRFFEIRFFRNIIIEHWYTYFEIKPGGSAVGISGELPTPLILKGAVSLEKNQATKATLENELSVHIPDISLAGLHYEEYADKIYQALKLIDPELGTCPPKRKKDKDKSRVTNEMIELLIEYEFPLPIYRINEYCKEMIDFLNPLLL